MIINVTPAEKPVQKIEKEVGKTRLFRTCKSLSTFQRNSRINMTFYKKFFVGDIEIILWLKKNRIEYDFFSRSASQILTSKPLAFNPNWVRIGHASKSAKSSFFEYPIALLYQIQSEIPIIQLSKRENKQSSEASSHSWQKRRLFPSKKIKKQKIKANNLNLCKKQNAYHPKVI